MAESTKNLHLIKIQDKTIKGEEQANNNLITPTIECYFKDL